MATYTVELGATWTLTYVSPFHTHTNTHMISLPQLKKQAPKDWLKVAQLERGSRSGLPAQAVCPQHL